MFIPPPASFQTGNWAGYEWNGGSVAATEFVVPAFPYSKMNTQEKHGKTVMSIWAGLGIRPWIEQIGIYDYITNGKVNWAGFCAFWPSSNVSCGHGISTGDEMFLSVHRNGLTYTMTMRDAGPHNKWVISITKTLDHKDTTAEAIMEDSTYPGTPFEPLTTFTPFRMATSGNPMTEVYDTFSYAKKTGSRSIEIE
jgi:hypothetical protein